MESVSQVSRALQIIENVRNASCVVLVNYNQIKRVADRMNSIGEGLKKYLKEFVEGETFPCGSNSNEDYFGFSELLRVLRKGEALSLSYKGELEAIVSNVASRWENRDAFRMIHEEIDTLKAQFPFEACVEDHAREFEVSTGIERSRMLTADAEKDMREMIEKLDSLRGTDLSVQETVGIALSMQMERIESVVFERIEPAQSSEFSLPEGSNYFRIKPAEIHICKEPVRRIQSMSRRMVLDGTAVHSGTWLGVKFAVKVFKSGVNDWNREQLLEEFGSLMELRHPHVVQVVGFAQNEGQCIVLMELMDSDLRYFMRSKPEGCRPFSRSEEIDIISQIAQGMYYLHTQQFVHGELRCSNILVKNHGKYLEVNRRSPRLPETRQTLESSPHGEEAASLDGTGVH